ncbi:hypothetical protein OAV36_02585 [Flavobacteriales bacterium]|nr:hypothetical protein [Flavobacteriales bacterium]
MGLFLYLPKIKDILRAISTTIIGVILGMMGMMAMHYLSMVFYPLPEGVTMEDAEALNKYMAIAPLGAMLLVIISHAMGSFIGAVLATLLSQISKWKNSTAFKYQWLVIGLIFTYAGWMNLQELTHPDWFKIDLLFYLPAAYLGYKLVAKRN